MQKGGYFLNIIGASTMVNSVINLILVVAILSLVWGWFYPTFKHHKRSGLFLTLAIILTGLTLLFNLQLFGIGI
jgi:hypothetical protein